ncbi:sugar ABC transporter substrate-binding protein [Actinorhabdospora filicis]|uniref:Sugar ABC transporter substrate-binding protein n=1 Tax=Actinorhabdospora filicis TaxID=1785913 RepID=A0A9W6W9A1_9ACTN|nr:hypothetical protein [Actinorhabdospora filicis]GLZ77783.1 sugar ABC transporter substrate-binding protein [Actinorhabdospora filicis]
MAINRRDTLKLFGAGAVALGAGPLLVGCGDGGGGSDVGNDGKELAPWPAYVPLTGPTPDLPGGEKGLQAAYTKYPSNLTDAGFATPGDKSDVTVSVISYGTPPTDVSVNKYWQAVNAALGVNLKIEIIPAANFVEVMSTKMAGNDLPDIMFFGAGYVLPRQEQFIQQVCADISEYVSGDNVKQFPALANIPSYTWQGLGRIGGRFYGVPTERPVYGGSLLVNRTALEKAGAVYEWDKAGFLSSLKAATGDKKYGMGFPMELNIDYLAGSLGAPNTWAVSADGKFTTTYESPQFKEALAMSAQLFKEGSAYPDGGSTSAVDMKTLFANQTVATYRDGWGAMGTSSLALAKGFTQDFGLPFGGAASTPWGGTGRFGFVAFKKADASRIKMLLAVCNYLAAPFGTKQYELFNYGVEGTHFTRGADGTPVPTELWTKGENGTTLPVKYIAAAPQALFYAGYPEAVERVYQWEKKVAPITIPDPSNGLRSAKWTENGSALTKAINDAILGVVFRGEDVSTFDGAVAKWKSDGGSQSADEFAAEYAAAK